MKSILGGVVCSRFSYLLDNSSGPRSIEFKILIIWLKLVHFLYFVDIIIRHILGPKILNKKIHVLQTGSPQFKFYSLTLSFSHFHHSAISRKYIKVNFD